MCIYFYYIFMNFHILRKSFQRFFKIGKHLTILGSQGTNGEQGTWKSFLLL